MEEIISTSNVALISFGSNLSFSEKNPVEIFSNVISVLDGYSSGNAIASSLYTTSPVDSPEGTPDFLNAVVAIKPETDESPQSLLSKLQQLESAWGRQRSGIKNEARTLDLDIISFRNEILNKPDLVIPHPRAHLRKFVLTPLVELCGESVKLAGWTNSAVDYLAELKDQEIALYKTV